VRGRRSPARSGSFVGFHGGGTQFGSVSGRLELDDLDCMAMSGVKPQVLQVVGAAARSGPGCVAAS
jgi:hypothetical protein